MGTLISIIVVTVCVLLFVIVFGFLGMVWFALRSWYGARLPWEDGGIW